MYVELYELLNDKKILSVQFQSYFLCKLSKAEFKRDQIFTLDIEKDFEAQIEFQQAFNDDKHPF